MLVKIAGERNKESLVTSSRLVAENFGKEHSKVIRGIEEIMGLAKIGDTPPMFYKTTYSHPQNKQEYQEYLMNRDGFSLLAMGFTGAKAMQWKVKYIEAFNEMEQELKRLYDERKQKEIERAKGMVVRNVLTDMIKNSIPESDHKNFAYPMYTNLIYKVLFDKNCKELKKMYGVKGKESIRDYMNQEELAEVSNLEMLVSSLIRVGWGYQQIKEFIQQNHIKQIAS